MLVGVTGYGMALLFILHGAPDLALTQVLVETVTLVVFVLVLRRLPTYFTDRPLTAPPAVRASRIGAGRRCGRRPDRRASPPARRSAEPVSPASPAAYEFGGGKNIVNVTLVDIRAWDTMGEISVLVVGRHRRRQPDLRAQPDAAAPPMRGRRSAERRPPSRGQALAARPVQHAAAGRARSIFEVVTRLMFHVIVVFSLYLLFAGHNAPGGGFAGGLVAGLALVVRYLAGGRYELDEAAPVDAGLVLGARPARRASARHWPAGVRRRGRCRATHRSTGTCRCSGDVHLVTSLFFDIGVYLVVVGLMLDILRSLGAASTAPRSEDRAAGATATGRTAGDVASSSLMSPNIGCLRRSSSACLSLPASTCCWNAASPGSCSACC